MSVVSFDEPRYEFHPRSRGCLPIQISFQRHTRLLSPAPESALSERLAKPLKRSPQPPCSPLSLTHYYVGTELFDGYFIGANRIFVRWRVAAARGFVGRLDRRRGDGTGTGVAVGKPLFRRVGARDRRHAANRYLPSGLELAGFFSDAAGFVLSLNNLWHAMQDRFNEIQASNEPSRSSSSAFRASSRIANWYRLTCA